MIATVLGLIFWSSMLFVGVLAYCWPLIVIVLLWKIYRRGRG